MFMKCHLNKKKKVLIIKDFKDTESINDRYLLKEKKQDKCCDAYNINLNNDTNPFIKEIYIKKRKFWIKKRQVIIQKIQKNIWKPRSN